MRKPKITIIGSGFAGLSAGLELAQRGFEVVLLEASPYLGGRTWLARTQVRRFSPSVETSRYPVCSLRGIPDSEIQRGKPVFPSIAWETPGPVV